MTRGCPDKSLARFERIALVLSGGGALGSYQAGAYAALEKCGVRPNWIAGTAIGAVNAAIIAGNLPHERAVRLRHFWRKLSGRVAARRPRGPTRWARGALANWLALGRRRTEFASLREETLVPADELREMIGEAVDFDRIKVLQGDTLYTPYSTSTWGSRSMVHGGGAVARASRVLAKRVAHIGAWLLQTDAAKVRIEDGKVIAENGSITLREVARAWYLQPQNLPADVDTGGLEVTEGYRAERDSGTFTYATHAAVVAVDPSTGLIEILDYVVVEDGGTLVNPMIVDGQICGGTAQGIGTCLYEVMPFDAQGQPLASTLLDYMLPGAPEVPDIRVLHMQTPSPYTEFGMKGLGEGGAVGPPAAIVSAVNDALRPLNVEIYDLPLTPERILCAIDAPRSAANG